MFLNITMFNQESKDDNKDTVFSPYQKKRRQLTSINLANNVAQKAPQY